jgi:hypothetical protein
MLTEVKRSFEERTPVASDDFPRVMQNPRALHRDRLEITKSGFHCGPSIFWNEAKFQPGQMLKFVPQRGLGMNTCVVVELGATASNRQKETYRATYVSKVQTPNHS